LTRYVFSALSAFSLPPATRRCGSSSLAFLIARRYR